MASPLAGYTVLDMAQVWAGPSAAMLLADQGARLIKIEPIEGEHSREVYKTPFLGDTSRSFLALNRNKLGVAVDIADARGKQVIHDLAKNADVVIQSFRPKVAARLGIDYEALKRVNPRLIFASVTGYGETGPYAEQPGYDFLLRALSGVLGENRYPDGTPIVTSVNVGDLSAAMLLAYGITLALLAREKTGQGQAVATSLLASSIAIQAPQIVKVERDDSAARRTASPIFNCFRCADGEYIAIVIPTDEVWASLCRALGLEHLSTDPSSSSIRARFENKDTVFSILDGVFSTKPRRDWLPALKQHDIPFAPVLSRDDVFKEPQTQVNGLITTADHPRFGPIKMMGAPVKLSSADYGPLRPAPDIGQHTRVVLLELGYSEQQIRDLHKAKVVFCAGFP